VRSFLHAHKGGCTPTVSLLDHQSSVLYGFFSTPFLRSFRVPAPFIFVSGFSLSPESRVTVSVAVCDNRYMARGVWRVVCPTHFKCCTRRAHVHV